MAEFTRRSLYDLVWSKPTRTAAAEIGVSDVWLAKACKSADIPVPERGYWARRQAGKPTVKRPLPPRFPGASDEISVGGGRSYYWHAISREEILNEPIPPEPTFDEDIEAVEARVRTMVGKVACPRQITEPHKFVAMMMEREAKRRPQYASYSSSMLEPRREDPMEKRRLRIWNALFVAFERLGCRVSMSTAQYTDDREVTVGVGDSSVPFNLEPVKTKSRGSDPGDDNNRLRLSVGSRQSSTAPAVAWEDTAERSLENSLTEVVVGILLTAERWYRNGQISSHKWRIERKAELEAEIRREKAEAERKARELRAKQEKERIDRLLAQARALDESNTIRAYVAAVQGKASVLSLPGAEIDLWVSWALGEADRIDPVKNGTVQTAIAALAEARATAE